jgi:hypothetical protein
MRCFRLFAVFACLLVLNCSTDAKYILIDKNYDVGVYDKNAFYLAPVVNNTKHAGFDAFSRNFATIFKKKFGKVRFYDHLKTLALTEGKINAERFKEIQNEFRYSYNNKIDKLSDLNGCFGESHIIIVSVDSFNKINKQRNYINSSGKNVSEYSVDSVLAGSMILIDLRSQTVSLFVEHKIIETSNSSYVEKGRLRDIPGDLFGNFGASVAARINSSDAKDMIDDLFEVFLDNIPKNNSEIKKMQKKENYHTF